jgi:hypothetical protein
VLCLDVLPLEWALDRLPCMVGIHRYHYTDAVALVCC